MTSVSIQWLDDDSKRRMINDVETPVAPALAPLQTTVLPTPAIEQPQQLLPQTTVVTPTVTEPSTIVTTETRGTKRSRIEVAAIDRKPPTPTESDGMGLLFGGSILLGYIFGSYANQK